MNKAAFRAQTDQLVELYGLPEWRRDESAGHGAHGGGTTDACTRLFKDHRVRRRRFRDGIRSSSSTFTALQCTADGFFEVLSQRPDGPSAIVPLWTGRAGGGAARWCRWRGFTTRASGVWSTSGLSTMQTRSGG